LKNHREKDKKDEKILFRVDKKFKGSEEKRKKKQADLEGEITSSQREAGSATIDTECKEPNLNKPSPPEGKKKDRDKKIGSRPLKIH